MRSSSTQTGRGDNASGDQDQVRQRNSGGGAGSLTVIGIGPGNADLIAPQAIAALEQAQAVAGYGTYLDLVPEALLAGKDIVRTGMKKELDRVRAAVELAAAGTKVAVVSSGDAGIYGMASLALEVLEEQGLLGSVELTVIPGIPALAAGAALLGAPLTHDFAVISLSDLLTPWDTIEKRLRCAAEGDFVIVIYNPRSKKRHWQLARAVEIVSTHRTPQTPVGLVRQAYRDEQDVHTGILAEFDPARADMLSIIFIGNSTTRLAAGRMLTPRGYMDKYGSKAQE